MQKIPPIATCTLQVLSTAGVYSFRMWGKPHRGLYLSRANAAACGTPALQTANPWPYSEGPADDETYKPKRVL